MAAWLVAPTLQAGDQALQAEALTGAAEHLRGAVAVGQQQITGPQKQPPLAIHHPRLHPQGRSMHASEHLGGQAAPVQQHRIVAGIAIAHLAIAMVDHADHQGGEGAVVVVVGQALIDASHDGRWRIERFGIRAQQAQADAHQQRRRHALARDIAGAEQQKIVPQPDRVVEVAADAATGHHLGRHPQARGKGIEMVAGHQQLLLDAGRHRPFLLQPAVGVPELGGAPGHILFGAGLPLLQLFQKAEQLLGGAGEGLRQPVHLPEQARPQGGSPTLGGQLAGGGRHRLDRADQGPHQGPAQQAGQADRRQ